MYPHGASGISSNIAQNSANQNTMGFSTFEGNILAKPRPFEEKGGLEWDIEQERFKIQQMEQRYRLEMEKVR